MNAHLEPKNRPLCVTNLGNSALLPVICALMEQIWTLNLLRPELIEVP